MDYRKRYYLLLIALPIVLLIIYKLTISNTLELKDNINQVQEDIDRSSLAPMNISILNKELQHLMVVIEKKDRISKKSLFGEITGYCSSKKLRVRSYPLEHKISNNKYSCNTSVISIEGRFVDLLKMLNVFEREKAYTIRSISFDKYKDRLLKTEKLQLKLYIQIIDNEK